LNTLGDHIDTKKCEKEDIADRAAQHRSSIMIRKHLEENKDVIRVEYLPKGSPDYNAVEECWSSNEF
jgi:hypothetical protein